MQHYGRLDSFYAPMPPGQATACCQAQTVIEAQKPAGHTFPVCQKISLSPRHL